MKRIFTLIISLLFLLFSFPHSASALKNRGNENKLIALTFDDGPGKFTDYLIDRLDSMNAKATFFVLGKNVAEHTETVKKAYQSGHQIGCHSWDHPQLAKSADHEIREQFLKTYAVLDKICGTGTDYLIRPPYGQTSPHIQALLNKPFILWSVDPRDWDTENWEKIKSHIISHAKPGAIILVHDIYKSSVKAAVEAVAQLTKEGYEFVTVNELFRRNGIALECQNTYRMCKCAECPLPPVCSPDIHYVPDSTGWQIRISGPESCRIYFSIHHMEFNGASKQYREPFHISKGETVYAVCAYNLNGCRSSVEAATPE